MGWVHDTGYDPAYDHEGLVLALLADGSEQRPGNSGPQVVAWCAGCACGWRGGRVHRRADYPDDDYAVRLGIAPDAVDGFPPDEDGSAPVGGGPSCYAEWEAHLRSALPELELHEALADDEAGRGPVDQAVHSARSAGASWAVIGRAAGITRQSAHERWAHLEADEAEAEGVASCRTGTAALQTHHALRAAVDSLEERGPMATARRHGPGWQITVTGAGVLETVELDSPEWAPNSAGHRLIERGWIVSSPAHFARDRTAGWAHREGDTWTAPVVRDDA